MYSSLRAALLYIIRFFLPCSYSAFICDSELNINTNSAQNSCCNQRLLLHIIPNNLNWFGKVQSMVQDTVQDAKDTQSKCMSLFSEFVSDNKRDIVE